MKRELLRRFVALKIEEARLRTAIEDMKAEVIAEVESLGGDIEFEGARLRVRKSKKWGFSEALESLNRALKSLRRSEIDAGTAQVLRETRIIIANLPKAQLPFREASDPPPPETAKWLTRIKEQHPRAYAAWSDDEERTLRTEFEQGASVVELAELLQRQRGGIRSRLKKMGLLD